MKRRQPQRVSKSVCASLMEVFVVVVFVSTWCLCCTCLSIVESWLDFSRFARPRISFCFVSCRWRFHGFIAHQYVADGTCTNTCQHSRDGYCDDPRSSGVCPSGTDCQVSRDNGDGMR